MTSVSSNSRKYYHGLFSWNVKFLCLTNHQILVYDRTPHTHHLCSISFVCFEFEVLLSRYFFMLFIYTLFLVSWLESFSGCCHFVFDEKQWTALRGVQLLNNILSGIFHLNFTSPAMSKPVMFMLSVFKLWIYPSSRSCDD